LASKCWAANAAQVGAGATGLIDCVGDGFASQVAACQSAGKKVMLSLGGAISNTYIPDAAAAKEAARMLWGLFLGGTSNSTLQNIRPFGPNLKLDGVDIDNEAPPYARYIPELVSALREYYNEDTSRQYYISAAPQCPRPDQSIPIPQIADKLDWVFVQFYNNPPCNLNTGAAFLDSLKSWSQDLMTTSMSNNANSNQHVEIGPPAMAPSTRPHSRRGAGRPPPKVFVGVLATPGSGFVDASGFKAILDSVRSLNLPNLGGVMYWDGAYQQLSGQTGGKSYAQLVKENM
jgi:chitinase